MFTPTIDHHYVERDWTRLPFVPMTQMNDHGIPIKRQDSGLSIINSESEAAQNLESLASRQSDPAVVDHIISGSLIWDYELLAADSVELATCGGYVTILSEDWKEFKAGALVMACYDNQDNSFGTVFFIENVK